MFEVLGSLEEYIYVFFSNVIGDLMPAVQGANSNSEEVNNLKYSEIIGKLTSVFWIDKICMFVFL